MPATTPDRWSAGSRDPPLAPLQGTTARLPRRSDCRHTRADCLPGPRRRLVAGGGEVSDFALLAAPSAHDDILRAAIGQTEEGNAVPVGRPRRADVVAALRGQLARRIRRRRSDVDMEGVGLGPAAGA